MILKRDKLAEAIARQRKACGLPENPAQDKATMEAVFGGGEKDIILSAENVAVMEKAVKTAKAKAN